MRTVWAVLDTRLDSEFTHLLAEHVLNTLHDHIAELPTAFEEVMCICLLLFHLLHLFLEFQLSLLSFCLFLTSGGKEGFDGVAVR